MSGKPSSEARERFKRAVVDLLADGNEGLLDHFTFMIEGHLAYKRRFGYTAGEKNQWEMELAGEIENKGDR